MPVIYSNGRICTLGPSGVVTQILVDDTGTVAAVGSQVTGHPLAAVATRYDLQGRTVLPGPVDSHDHLLWHGPGHVKGGKCANSEQNNHYGRLQHQVMWQ